ncbi:MAG: AI-2E family transporter [Alphaproteobacteria bacterium]|nr:AI-2E family transporter [Alphaproteobacteria bacterium]
MTSSSEETHKRYRMAFVLILTLVVCLALAALIRDFLLAVLMAVVFSALLHPVYRRVRAVTRARPSVTSGLVMLIVLVAVGIPLLVVAGLVAAEALGISKAVSPWIQGQLRGESALGFKLPTWLPFNADIEPYKTQIIAKLGEAAAGAGKFFFESIREVTRGTFAVLLNLFVFLYAMFFFLMRGPELLDSALRYLPLNEPDRDRLIDRGLTVTKATLKSILIIGVLQGLLVALAFWVLGIEGAAFWGTMVLILSAIPGLGSAIVWVPAAVYLFTVDQFWPGMALSLWGVLVVGLVDNILRPRLVGEEAKIPDLLILLSILGGIAGFGVVGIVVGPILAAVFLTVLDIYRTVFAEHLPVL